MNHYIAKVRQYIAYQFNDLDLHDQIYKLSGLMLAAYLAIAAIAQMASEATLRTYITEPFVWVFGLTLAVAVIIEHWAHIKPYVETKWFKFVGAVLSYFAYQLPEIKAHHFINSYTGIDPAQLGDAATLPTALYVVYVWIIIAFALVALAGLLTWLYIGFWVAPFSKDPWETLKCFGRIAGTLAAILVLGSVLTSVDDERLWPKRVAQAVVLATEYFPESMCSQLEERVLVAEMGGGRMSVYDVQSQNFSVATCSARPSEQDG